MSEFLAWVPASVMHELDSRMENAFRRVSGSVGYDISFDSGRARALKDTAAQALDAGLESVGPMFMRMGRGLYEAKGLRAGPGISLRDLAGEILREFYNEGNSAYQVCRSALYADALKHLESRGLDSGHVRAILTPADDSFVPPSKDAFTKAAEPMCSRAPSPSTLALLGGGAGFALGVFLLRSPVLAIIGALAAGGFGFYLGRSRQRSSASMLASRLPRILYDILRSGLQSNVKRYADTVNAALKKLE